MSSNSGLNRDALARLGHLVFPRRLWVGLSVVGIATLVVKPRPFWGDGYLLWNGVAIALILAGLAGRAWAAGCAGRHTTLARIEAPRLVTGGPYAFVRNPIYLASVVLGFGMVLLLGDWWMLGLHLGVCLLLYAGIIPAEEEFLRRTFGEEYERYAENVPRMWPRFAPWCDATQVRWEPQSLLDQARLGGVLVAIYALLKLAAWLRH